MPGYTHLQRAQTVQFSHWLLSHAFALRGGLFAFCDVRSRSNILPLGSGALAGNPLQIDRVWLAERLGFAAVTANSMHAVGDRDFVGKFGLYLLLFHDWFTFITLSRRSYPIRHQRI
ncbi:hypothetical protein DOY81_012361 [Sarcophaga bullata]|nr:hypothetical protein DOY81_012361 [Sarcophaga bullata]